MNSTTNDRCGGMGERLALALLWTLWQAVRLPLLGVLKILEPVVRVVLSAFALVVTLTSLLFEFASSRPFPFVGVLAVALGASALLALYEALIWVLADRRG